MADLIVDPTNENVALKDGEILHGVRLAPAGTPVSEMAKFPIIGYGKLTLDGEEDNRG